MITRVFALLEPGQIYFYNEKTSKCVAIDICGIEPIPNIPSYHQLWNKEKENLRSLKNIFRTLYVPRIIKPYVFLLMPDDIVDFDMRCMVEYFMIGQAKRVITCTLGVCLSGSYESCIIITRSERNLILQYYRMGACLAVKYLDKNEFDIDLVRHEIDSLHNDLRFEKPKILIYGVPHFYPLGDMVSVDQLFKTFKIGVEKTKGISRSTVRAVLEGLLSRS